MGGYGHQLADDEKRELLRIARASLRELCASGRLPPGAPHRATLTAPAAVVVEVRVDGRVIEGRHDAGTLPLYRAIQDALQVAVKDAALDGEAARRSQLAVCVRGEAGEQRFDETSHPPPPPVVFKRQ